VSWIELARIESSGKWCAFMNTEGHSRNVSSF
jgi:hypothetical protein